MHDILHRLLFEVAGVVPDSRTLTDPFSHEASLSSDILTTNGLGDHNASINRIFDVYKLGVSTYLLAIIYAMLFIISFLRYRHVNGFVAQFNTSKALYVAAAVHLLVRAASFSLLSFFNVAGKSTKVWYPLLVMLITFPEYCIISMYFLVFLAWLEIYIFSHHQFILNSRERFRRISRIAFGIASAAVYGTVVILYALLAISKDDFDDSMAVIIEWSCALGNVIFPFVVICIGLFFAVRILAGFPLSSPLSMGVVKKLHQLFVFWTLGRIARGIVIFLSIVYEYHKHTKSETFSLITFLYLTVSEFVPLLMLLDFAMVSIVIVADEVTQASPPVIADDEGLGETQDATQLSSDPSQALLGMNVDSSAAYSSLDRHTHEGVIKPPVSTEAGHEHKAGYEPPNVVVPNPQPRSSISHRRGENHAQARALVFGDEASLPHDVQSPSTTAAASDVHKLSDLTLPLELVAPALPGAGATGSAADATEAATAAGPGAPTVYVNPAALGESASFSSVVTTSPAMSVTASPAPSSLAPSSPSSGGRGGSSHVPTILSDNGVWISSTGLYRGRRVLVKRFALTGVRESTADQIVNDLERRTATLTHPRLSKMLFCARHKADVYVVQEFVARRSIEDLFRAVDKDLAPATIIKFAMQIASALDYLHARNLIHGNLKSSDILLDERMNVRVADPGMRPLKALAEVSAGHRLVTAYTAPECMTGSPPNKASDVYSFGVICWRMTLRKKPFESMTTAELVERVGYGGYRLKTPTAMDLTHTSATIAVPPSFHPTSASPMSSVAISPASASSGSSGSGAAATTTSSVGSGYTSAPGTTQSSAGTPTSGVTVVTSALPPTFVSMIARCFSEPAVRPSFTDVLQILHRIAPDINPRAQ